MNFEMGEREAFMAFNYGLMCEQSATDQGLDPITERLRAAGIPHTVDQTGGFTMCVNVPLVEGGSEYLYITDADDPFVAIGRYWDGGVDGCEWGQCWADYPDTGTGVHIDDMVAHVRSLLSAGHQPCPNKGEPWHH
jgi:hypothetical protein